MYRRSATPLPEHTFTVLTEEEASERFPKEAVRLAGKLQRKCLENKDELESTRIHKDHLYILHYYYRKLVESAGYWEYILLPLLTSPPEVTHLASTVNMLQSGLNPRIPHSGELLALACRYPNEDVAKTAAQHPNTPSEWSVFVALTYGDIKKRTNYYWG